MTLLFETSPASPGERALSGAGSAAAGPQQKPRLTSIDLLRGLVMIVMALDHTRDFFSVGGFNPRDRSRFLSALDLAIVRLKRAAERDTAR